MKPFKPQFTFQCNQKPEDMESRRDGKYCQACAKTLVDFTKMSDAEIIAFFKRKPQNICGIMRADQQKVYYPISPQSQRVQAKAPFWPMVALALGTFASVPWASSLAAQHTTRGDIHQTAQSREGGIRSATDSPIAPLSRLNIKVVDEDGQPIIGAVVTLSLGDSLLQGEVTGYEGTCQFNLFDHYHAKVLSVKAEYVGTSAQKSFKVGQEQNYDLGLSIEHRMLLGEMEVFEPDTELDLFRDEPGTRVKIHHR